MSEYDFFLVIATFIASFAAIAGIALTNRAQNNQLRLHIGLEILKILGDDTSRKSRTLVYEAYRIYKQNGQLDIFTAEQPDYNNAVATVRSDFQTIGSILYKNKGANRDFLNTWLQPTITCYKALKDSIYDVETKLNFRDYMFYFKWLYQEAESEWSIAYRGIPSPEPF